MKVALPLFLFLVTFAVPLKAEEPSGSAPSNNPSNSIVGIWRGAYFSYPELMVVKLTVRSLPMDRIEGECELSPAVEPKFRNSGSHGNYRFKGTYTPWAKEFSIKPGESIAASNTQQPISGVFDTSGDRLVGFAGALINNQLPVVLARDQRGEQLVAEILASAYPPEAPRPSGVPSAARAEGAGLDKLAKWASRLETEFPSLDVRHTQMQDLYRFAQNLFDDDYFRQFFDTTYDKLDVKQRRSLHDFLARAPASGPLGKFRFLSSAFGTRQSFSSDYITVWAFWQRAIRSWTDERLRWMAQLPPDFNSFVLLKSVESLGETELSTVWQSDLARFKTTVADTRSRLAPVILEREADQALAKATTIEESHNLVGWIEQGRQKEVAQYVGNDLKQKLSARLEARVDELITQPIADQEAKLSSFGQGKDAVLAGNKWYSDLNKRFGFAAVRPSFQRALQQLQARRASDLAAAATTIGADLESQTTQSSLDGKLKEYLAVPGDGAAPAAVQLRSVVDKRRAEIRSKEYLAYFSANERQWSPKPDGTLTAPAVVPPPDGEDIRMAWVRTLESFDGTRVGPYTVHTFGYNPVARLTGLYVAVTVQSAHRISFEAAEGGFDCTYTISLKGESADVLKRQAASDPTTAVIERFMEGLWAFAKEVRKDRFELGERGWWSPTVREEMLKRRVGVESD